MITIEWTFLAECDLEKSYCDSRVKLSVFFRVLYLTVFASVLLWARTTLCIEVRGMQLEGVDQAIRRYALCKRSIVRRRYGQMKRRFMRGRERTTKALTKWVVSFLVVCVGLSHSARRSSILWNPVHVHRSIGKGDSQVIFRPEQEQVPAPADVNKKQVRTTVKKHCVLLIEVTSWVILALSNHVCQAMHLTRLIETRIGLHPVVIPFNCCSAQL